MNLKIIENNNKIELENESRKYLALGWHIKNFSIDAGKYYLLLEKSISKIPLEEKIYGIIEKYPNCTRTKIANLSSHSGTSRERKNCLNNLIAEGKISKNEKGEYKIEKQ